MNKKYFGMLLSVALVAGCASTQTTQETKEPDQEEVYIPVEQVWPEIPQPRISATTKANAGKNVRTSKNNRQISYKERRVVQVAANKPSIGKMNSNIQEGSVRGVRNVTSTYGENHEVPIALNYPTLFITPFATPDLKGDFEKKPVEYEIVGSNIVLIPQKNQRTWIMVFDKANPRGMPISLTLIPRAGLMSQTVNLAVGRLSPSEQSNGLGAAEGSFAQQLASVLNDIARLRIPSGYTVRPLKEKITMQNGMQAMPVERYAGGRFDVYRYRLTNNTGRVQELAEEMFGTPKRVRAVSFYPKKTLYPGEVTDVLIMTSKSGGVK